MKDLAIYYRCAQFYSHAAHNLAFGDEFFQDHEYLGELYGAYETAYDDIIERMIGLGKSPDPMTITLSGAETAKGYGIPKDDKEWLVKLMEIE